MKHEKQEQSLRENATALRKGCGRSQNHTHNLLVGGRGDIIGGWSQICEEVQLHEHRRHATVLTVLGYPIPLLEENDLSKLNPRK
jgi:hypothetical protein